MTGRLLGNVVNGGTAVVYIDVIEYAPDRSVFARPVLFIEGR